MSKAIILNGPPGTGKDTIANALEGFEHMRVKEHLISLTCKMFCLNRQIWENRYSDRKLKEEPWEVLPENILTGGREHHSQRSLLIFVSEVIMKPFFGKSYFGKIAATKLKVEMATGTENFVFSDGGFVEEVDEICQVVDKVVLVQLYRRGCNWGDDSRDYLKIHRGNLTTISIPNNSTIEEAVGALMVHV